MGFEALEPVEHLRVLKMTDATGAMIELVEGHWHPHVAVNWYETEDGNYVETVEEKAFVKCPWGFWDLDGNWFYNPNILMSENEQRKQNIINGYKC